MKLLPFRLENKAFESRPLGHLVILIHDHLQFNLILRGEI